MCDRFTTFQTCAFSSEWDVVLGTRPHIIRGLASHRDAIIASNLLGSPSNATKCRPLSLPTWIEATRNHNENHPLANWTKFKHMQSNIHECKAMVVVPVDAYASRTTTRSLISASIKSSMDLESFFRAPLQETSLLRS